VKNVVISGKEEKNTPNAVPPASVVIGTPNPMEDVEYAKEFF